MACLGKTNGTRAMKCLVGLMIFLAGASMAVAQLPTGTILGTVKDPSGQVVADANLTARNVETGQTRTVTTSGDGSYRLAALPIGSYTIQAEHEGFSVAARSGVVLSVGQEAVVNFALQLGAVSQTVSVTGEAPLVNTTSGSLADLVDEQKIAELPLNGRNYVDLMLLQPGISQQVNKSAGGGQVGTWFSSNGAPVRSNNMLLDGAIITNGFGAGASSASGSTLGIDGIREWRVITNSFSAEYGMTMGSQMLIASKGGSNTFHGTAFEYLRNEVLDATNFFYVPAAANGFARIPPYKRNNFGASFGGPIKKDKTFFYGVYEGLRERLGITTVDTVLPAADYVTTNNPGCGGCNVPAVIQPILAQIGLLNGHLGPNIPGTTNKFTYPFTQPTNENYGQMRMDQNISAADSVFARYTIDDSVQTQTGGYPQFTTLVPSRNQFVTLSENHIFSASLLNTARFSFSRTNLAQTDPPSGLIGPQYSFIPGLEFGRLNITGVTPFSAVLFGPQDVKQNIFTWSDDAFKSVGRHALKFGVLINHYQEGVLRTTDQRGTISFADISHFLLGTPASYGTGLTPGSVLGRTYHFSTLGFYAQDDLRVRSNLTFNIGLRYEFTTTVNETQGHGASFRNIATDAAPTVGPPFKNPSLHNFSPRIGFAWDVMGNGKTAVRGGFGLLYDIATLGFSLFQTNLVPPFGSQVTVVVPANTLLALPLVLPAAAKSLNGIQWDLKQPQMTQYNLAVDRQLPGNMALTVAYGGSRGRHLMQTTEGNPTIPTMVGGQPTWNGSNPRLNPLWGSDQLTASGGDSWYNSLQVLLTKRLSKGLEFQGSYSWAKAIDDGQGQAGGENTSTPVYPAYPNDVSSYERGRASFDITQNLRFNAIYQFRDFHSKQGILGHLLSGWGTTGILTAQSGYPFTPALSVNRSRSGSSGGANVVDRPNLVPGRTIYSVTHGTSTGCGTGATRDNGGTAIAAGTPLGTPSLYLDPCAFTLQPAGTLGNVGRNSFRGAGLTNLDLSIIKDTPLKFREGAKLQFRAEFFNIFNHPNFITPQLSGANTADLIYAGTVADTTENPAPTAGVLNNTSNTARQIQFALKLLF